MRLGLQLGYDDPVAAVALAEEADRLGFHSVWTSEAYGADAVTPMGWLAGRTSQVRIGSGIMQMPARSPAATAATVATLDLLSGGRALLGLGTSGPQVAEGWHGQRWGKPLERTREYVDVVRTILRREQPLEHHGEHYDIPYTGDGATGLGKPLKLITRPLRAEVPIYLAAIGPRNVALAAEIADGWLPILFSPERIAEVHGPHLEEGFARRGGRPADFDVAPLVPVVVADDVGLARDFLRPVVALYVGGMGARGQNFYNRLACRYGFEAEAAPHPGSVPRRQEGGGERRRPRRARGRDRARGRPCADRRPAGGMACVRRDEPASPGAPARGAAPARRARRVKDALALALDVEVADARLLAGGASKEAWAVDTADGRELLVRRALGGVIHVDTLPLRDEFEMLVAAREAGVRVPEPIAYLGEVDGREAFAMDARRRRDDRPTHREEPAAWPRDPDGRAAGADSSRFPPSGCPSCPRPTSSARLRQELDTVGEPHPAIEYGLAWCRTRLPLERTPVVSHGDFRIGNLAVGDDGIVAVLDWEFAKLGDPAEDLAWPLVRAWRFGADERRLGGVDELEPYLARYEELTGLAVPPDELDAWEVLGNCKWAVGALNQARRHLSGEERSVELAILGRLAVEMEWELLDLIGRIEGRGERGARPGVDRHRRADPPRASSRPRCGSSSRPRSSPPPTTIASGFARSWR